MLGSGRSVERTWDGGTCKCPEHARGFLLCDLFRIFLLLNEVGWKTDSYPMAGHLDGCSGAQARGPRQNSDKLPFGKLT